MMLAASYTMERALRAIRREKQALFRIYLSATVAFAGIFVAIQTPAMVQLFHEHEVAKAQYEEQKANLAPAKSDSSINGDEMMPGRRSMPFYGLIMVLILIHALHVIGGMVSLGIIAWNGYHDRYDHENYAGVSHCVMYWHFLDGVWIVMFVVISAFG
ncbi:MAG: cytochrome c oxidase subunit 3 [Tepidisphaeraceae bacterium]